VRHQHFLSGPKLDKIVALNHRKGGGLQGEGMRHEGFVMFSSIGDRIPEYNPSRAYRSHDR
jgi:hypothetical protein